MKYTTTEKPAPTAPLEEVLAQKEAIARKLINEQDAIIDGELRRHEEAAFYIHLQSQCFNLYPLLTRLLLHMIEDPRRRQIFCSIINRKDVHRLARHLDITPKEVGEIFVSTVRELSRRTSELFDAVRRCDELTADYRKLLKQFQETEKEWRRLCNQESCLQKQVGSLEARCQMWKEEVENSRAMYAEAHRQWWESERKVLMLRERLEEAAHTENGLLVKLRRWWHGK